MRRFWSKTRRSRSKRKTRGVTCLLWTGSLHHSCERADASVGGRSLRHGTFKLDGKKEKAHRVAKSLATGTPLRALGLIAHACDNPRCVEPRHLDISSNSENLRDAYARGRRGIQPVVKRRRIACLSRARR